MSNGPILVTGAGGFVCSEIALALHRAGREVVAVDRVFDAATVKRLEGVRRIEGEVVQVLSTQAPRSVGAVIHGAAITAAPDRLGISRATHIRRNTDLLTATLDFAHGAGAKRVLALSSMGVFNPDDTPSPAGRFTEATKPTATCAYCAAKRAGELLTTSATEADFATLNLRLGNIFGPHEAVRQTRQSLCLVQRMLSEARRTGIITLHTPDAMREWSWLPDLADAIAALMSAPLEVVWKGAPVLHAGIPPVVGDLTLARLIADRVLGTTIRLAPPPHALIRPPMGSDYGEAFGSVKWTTMDAALDALIRVEVAG